MGRGRLQADTERVRSGQPHDPRTALGRSRGTAASTPRAVGLRVARPRFGLPRHECKCSEHAAREASGRTIATPSLRWQGAPYRRPTLTKRVQIVGEGSSQTPPWARALSSPLAAVVDARSPRRAHGIGTGLGWDGTGMGMGMGDGDGIGVG